MGLQARGLGLTTDSLEMRRGVPDPRGLARLVRIVRAWKPDVVHSHMVHANLMARVLRLLVPVPVLVSTIHNVYEGGPLLMAGYRLTNGLVDHMTIISQAAADRFVGERIVPGRLLTVIANGVDTDRMRNVPPEAQGCACGAPSAWATRSSSGWRWGGSRSRRTIPTCCVRSRRSGRASRGPCSSSWGRDPSRPRRRR